MLPLAVDLRGRHVVVVGTSRGASHRVSRLVAEGADVTVVGPAASRLGMAGIRTVDRPFQDGDCDGAVLVVAATGGAKENARVAKAAADRGILVNAVDDPAASSCYFTAEHHAGDVVIAVSTSGASPALAQWLRDAVVASLPEGVAEVAVELRRRRHSMHALGQSTEGLDWASVIEELLHSRDRPLWSRREGHETSSNRQSRLSPD
jgi:precorrin-2 dehydrogenase/sirohydrochlorin ferrochelatase